MAKQTLLGLNNIPSPTRANIANRGGELVGGQAWQNQAFGGNQGTQSDPLLNRPVRPSGGVGGNQPPGPGSAQGGNQGWSPGVAPGPSQGGNAGWQPLPVGSNTGMNFSQVLQAMMGGVNNNISSAGFGGGGGGGQTTGQWQHNYQPNYFPYHGNSGTGFMGGTAGNYMRPQPVGWGGDNPGAQGAGWGGDSGGSGAGAAYTNNLMQARQFANNGGYSQQGQIAQAVARANRQLNRNHRNDPNNWMQPGGDKDWRNVAKNYKNNAKQSSASE